VRQEQQKMKISPRYDGTCRRLDPEEAKRRVRAGERHVIRFKIPMEGATTAHDRLRGDIIVENKNIDDYIIIKSDGWALYHLAAMVDDHLMEITHVIRGSEWLPTFPLHVQIVRAFGWQEPEWVHLSIFLKPSGKGKMSKRDTADAMKDGFSIYLTDLRELGYLPEAVVNWSALMGWSYDDRAEFFTLADLVEKFSLTVSTAPRRSIQQADHFNALHRNLVPDLAQRLKPFFEKAGYTVDEDSLLKVTPLLQERIVTLDDAPAMGGFFFEDDVTPNPQDLVGKLMTPAESAEAARRILEILENLPEINRDSAEELVLSLLADELGYIAGQVFTIMRAAVTGKTVSPPLFESMGVIGKKKVLKRIRQAVKVLKDLKE
jgi:glutamyl-tRNA synthetase